MWRQSSIPVWSGILCIVAGLRWRTAMINKLEMIYNFVKTFNRVVVTIWTLVGWYKSLHVLPWHMLFFKLMEIMFVMVNASGNLGGLPRIAQEVQFSFFRQGFNFKHLFYFHIHNLPFSTFIPNESNWLFPPEVISISLFVPNSLNLLLFND